jgi:radical SAM superfamily enzyme YgiQ (UPF0313 family)
MQAGCYKISFSPDAASNESLKALGKHFTEDDIYKVIRIVRKVKKIQIGFSFFCTPPGQDFIGVLKTIKLYFVAFLSTLGRGGPSFSWIRIEPETRMHKIGIQEGILREETDLLPESEEGLKKLFYSCPKTRAYADPFFLTALSVLDRLKQIKRLLLGRRKPPMPAPSGDRS